MKESMKFSEAILLGSIGSIQGYGMPSADPRNRESGLCAIGAALLSEGLTVEASGENPYETSNAFRVVRTRWPWLEQQIPVPEALKIPRIQSILRDTSSHESIWGIVWRLNDHAEWTRPQIAEWIAGLEAIEEAKHAAQTAVSVEFPNKEVYCE